MVKLREEEDSLLVDMTCSVAKQRSPRDIILKVIIRVRNMQPPLIIRIAIISTDKGNLAMVMEIRMRDSHVVTRPRNINTPIIVTSFPHARELAVVDPHVGRLGDSDGVAVVGFHACEDEVADDDVADAVDFETDVVECLIELDSVNARGFAGPYWRRLD